MNGSEYPRDADSVKFKLAATRAVIPFVRPRLEMFAECSLVGVLPL